MICKLLSINRYIILYNKIEKFKYLESVVRENGGIGEDVASKIRYG